MPPDLTRTRAVRASAASSLQARNSASLIDQDLCTEIVKMCNDASPSENLQIQHLPPKVTSHQPPSMQNSCSKQAVGYSKESHLYSDVTAPSPAKISVNAFSPGRFSVQTRCLV